MRWSSRFVAQPSAEEVVALLRSVHEITAETQGEPINKSILCSSIVFAGPEDSNLGGCFSAANLTWSLGAKCPKLTVVTDCSADGLDCSRLTEWVSTKSIQSRNLVNTRTAIVPAQTKESLPCHGVCRAHLLQIRVYRYVLIFQ